MCVLPFIYINCFNRVQKKRINTGECTYYILFVSLFDLNLKCMEWMDINDYDDDEEDDGILWMNECLLFVGNMFGYCVGLNVVAMDVRIYLMLLRCTMTE